MINQEWIDEVTEYLDNEWSHPVIRQWELEQEDSQVSQPDHLSMINECEWKDWLGI